MHARCLNNELTTGIPDGTVGAFRRYDKNERTGWKWTNPPLVSVLYVMRVKSSHRAMRSMIKGAARRESSQVL